MGGLNDLNMIYVGTSFSLGMLKEPYSTIKVSKISRKEFDMASAVGYSCCGHQNTAKLLKVDYNRESIKLKKGDKLFVAQLQGPRLPEGATKLPKNRSFKFYKVKLL